MPETATVEFTRFYEEKRERLYRAVAATVADPYLAAEAVDEAFVRCWQRWSSVRGYRDPAGWVFRVAVNWATSWRRKLRLRPTLPTDSLHQAWTDVVPDTDLWQAIQQLPRKARRDIVLRFYLEFTPTEIAHLVGEPVGTVKNRIHRAVRTLGDREEIDA